VQAGPYGPEKTERAVVATTDPETLPDKTTWYLVTNLPAPGSVSAEQSPLTEASLAEVIRLYGLRMWIEQSYKQVKHASSVVRVSGEIRPSHPSALATRMLCFFLLLVSP